MNIKSTHPIIFVDYYPRLSGHFFTSTCTMLGLGVVGRQGTIAYILLWIELIIWPHLALYASLRSKDPKNLELNFLLLDSLFIGAWAAYMGFQLFPTTVYITSTAIGNFSISGVGMGLRGLGANALGALIVVQVFGLVYHPDSTPTLILYSSFALLMFSNVTGFLTYYRALVAKKTRAKLREVMEELDHINKILQKSSASLQLTNIMRILEEFLKDQVISFEALGLQIIQPETNELQLKVLIYDKLDDKEINFLKFISTNNMGKNIVEEVLMNQSPKYISDIHEEKVFNEKKSMSTIQSMAVYPVIIKNRSVGVITFYSTMNLKPTEAQIKVISNYINYVSLIINNTLLYDDLQNKREEFIEKNNQLNAVSTQLAKYIPPQVFMKIMQGEVGTEILAHKKFLTVFFSDIVGFTNLSDLLPSNVLTPILNTYLDSMTNIALKHGGTIDKYMGDVIMVFFGDPDSHGSAEDAKKCALMAIEMRNTLEEIGKKWQESGVNISLKTRMGIHSGICAVGNFGSNFRMNYTSIGSVVNLTSRLQHLAKPNEILISEETWELIRDGIKCVKKGQATIKGIDHPVTIYKIVDEKPI